MNIYKAVRRVVRLCADIVSIQFAAAVLAFGACIIFPAVVPGSGVASAQNTNATIRGQVLDPSGALVADADVVIVNQDTCVKVFSGKSDSAGAFVAPQVIPGTYRITVSAPGLKQAVIENLRHFKAFAETGEIPRTQGQPLVQ